MRAVLVEAPEAMLEERRRLGHDVFDEMWEGVLHMVPPAGGPHQRLGSFFLQALGPGVRRSGLVIFFETGLYLSVEDYRVPDLAVYRPEHASDRGIDGTAELVVELRSPRDESYEKLDRDADHPPRHQGGRALRPPRDDLPSGGTRRRGRSHLRGTWRAPVHRRDRRRPRLRVNDDGSVTDC